MEPGTINLVIISVGYRVKSIRDVEFVDEFAVVILDNMEGYLTLLIVTYQ